MKAKILTEFKCYGCGEILNMDKIDMINYFSQKDYFCPNCDRTLFTIKETEQVLSEDLDITYKEKKIYREEREVKNIKVGDNQELLFDYTETPITNIPNVDDKVVYTADISRIDLVSSAHITHIPHAEYKMSMSTKDIISSKN